MTFPNRRADDFDRALTAGTPHADPAIAALVAVAGALAAVPKGPAPAFREGLRATLMAEAATVAATVAAAPAAAALPVSPLQTLAKVLAKPAMQVATGGLAATIAVAGVGAGAVRSLPGDALYGLKRAIAGADDSGDLAGANARVQEIVALLERDGLGAAGAVQDALDDLKTDLDAVTADLLGQVRAGSRAAYDRLAATVDELSDALQALRDRLPAEARDELDAAMATVNAVRAQLAALPLPGGRPVLPVSPAPTTTAPTTRPGPTTPPPATPPTPTPSSPGPIPPTISPSTPPVERPTITVPPVTVPPVPTVGPTLPEQVPPLVP